MSERTIGPVTVFLVSFALLFGGVAFGMCIGFMLWGPG